MCIAIASYAQDKAAIEAALNTFDQASGLPGMRQSIKEMKAVSDSDPDDWYSAYWTSFFYSQTGRLTQAAKTYYDSAQIYFDKANAIHKDKSKVETSDFHALQSLIYNLQSSVYWQMGDRTNGMKLDNQSNQELNLAIKANINNPRVYLLSGTDLISNGQRTQNNGWVLAGKEILEKAKTLYSSQKPSSSIAPSWGSGWVNFWIARAKVD